MPRTSIQTQEKQGSADYEERKPGKNFRLTTALLQLITAHGGCLVAITAPPSQSSKPRDSCGTIVAFARQATTVRPGSGPDKLAAAVPDYGRRGRSPVSLEGPQRARRALSTVRCAVHCERPGAETSSSIVVHRNRSRTASSRTVPV